MADFPFDANGPRGLLLKFAGVLIGSAGSILRSAQDSLYNATFATASPPPAPSPPQTLLSVVHRFATETTALLSDWSPMASLLSTPPTPPPVPPPPDPFTMLRDIAMSVAFHPITLALVAIVILFTSIRMAWKMSVIATSYAAQAAYYLATSAFSYFVMPYVWTFLGQLLLSAARSSLALALPS